MKLATLEQVEQLLEAASAKLQAPSVKRGPSSDKHQAFFQDPVFNGPDLWYKLWLEGIYDYLKRRATSAELRASSVKQQAATN